VSSGNGGHSIQSISPSLRHPEYRLEFVRHLEQQPELVTSALVAEAEAGALSDSGPGNSSSGFEDLAQGRASWLVALLRLDSLHARVDRAAVQSLWVLCVVFALLGALAAAQGFDPGQQTVNFFWLLVVLLGVHLAALLFWLLAFLSRPFRQSTVKVPMLQSAGLWLVQKLARVLAPDTAARDPEQAGSVQPALSMTTVAAVWARLQTKAGLGFWNFSLLSHAVWTAYLIGGFGMTLLLLSLRQYDFVWATTVLSSETFEQMSALLGQVPQLLGIAVPDAQLVQISRTGVETSSETASIARVLWSNLLMASLVLWGVIPRVVLLAISLVGRATAMRKVSLDLASPYYVGLRQHLLTGYRRGGIIDPDHAGRSHDEVSSSPSASAKLPERYDIAAIYLDPQLPWPLRDLNPQHDLGCIDDAKSEAVVTAAAAASSCPHLVLCSHLATVPDRGVRRIVGALKRNYRGRVHLGLLTPDDRPADHNRLEDWYRLAAAVGISLDDIIQLPIRAPGFTAASPVEEDDRHAN